MTRLVLPIVAAAAMYGCQSGAERDARAVPEIDRLLDQAEDICNAYNTLGYGSGVFDAKVEQIHGALDEHGLSHLEVSCAGNPGELRFNVGPVGSTVSRDEL